MHCHRVLTHDVFLQKCSFDVGSWAHLASEIDIVPKEPSPTDLSFFQPSATFKVTNFSGNHIPEEKAFFLSYILSADLYDLMKYLIRKHY